MGIRAGMVVVLALLLVATPGIAPAVSHPLPHAGGPSSAPLLADIAPVPAGTHPQPVPPETPVRMTLTLAFSNGSRLTSYLASVENPASPQYRHFLTDDEFRSQFSPSIPAVLSARSVLASAGGRSVTVTADRLGVAAIVPASGVESLLGVRLVEYRSGSGDEVYTSLGFPVLPPALRATVVGVGGLSNVGAAPGPSAIGDPTSEPMPAKAPEYVYDNLSRSQWDVGSDFAQAYRVTDLWPGNHSVSGATYPRGVAIATLLAAGYNVSFAQELPPWDPRVLDQYFNETLGPAWPHPNVTGVPVTPSGAPTPPLPGPFGTATDSTADETENSLDLEMAGSTAPGADLYNFYFAGSLLAVGNAVLGSIADDLANDLSTALTYAYGSARLAAVSGSFGLPELNDSLWNADLVEAAATGVTVVCSSGDQGDAPSVLSGSSEGPGVLWPSSAGTNSTGAVAVGGVSAELAGGPSSYYTGGPVAAAYDPNITGLATQSAWYNSGGVGHISGSEGGISTVFPEPEWEFHSAAQPPIVSAAELQKVSSLGRAVPDVALPANDTIAYVFANSTGTVFLEVVGGTSVAAPLFAGLLASVVAVENATVGRFGLGFVTPELYRIASFYSAAAVVNTSAEAADPFLDVYNGSNYLFSAARGWDPVTGWGGVNASAFLSADENSTVSGYQYSGPTPVLPAAPHSPPVTETEVLILIVGALVAVAVVVVGTRPARGSGVPPTSAPGTTVSASPFGPAVPGLESHGTFLCPYCGAERPSEPVRCPQCGSL